MTTNWPQTHISIAVRGFNVKLPIDLGIELRVWFGFALGKQPLQVSLCMSKRILWAHSPNSALLNYMHVQLQLPTASSVEIKTKPHLFKNFSGNPPGVSCCPHSQFDVNHFLSSQPLQRPLQSSPWKNESQANMSLFWCTIWSRIFSPKVTWKSSNHKLLLSHYFPSPPETRSPLSLVLG